MEEWINEYFKNPVEYIKSTGTTYLLDIIHKITHIHLQKNTKKFIINWY